MVQQIVEALEARLLQELSVLGLEKSILKVQSILAEGFTPHISYIGTQQQHFIVPSVQLGYQVSCLIDELNEAGKTPVQIKIIHLSDIPIPVNDYLIFYK